MPLPLYASGLKSNHYKRPAAAHKGFWLAYWYALFALLLADLVAHALQAVADVLVLVVHLGDL